MIGSSTSDINMITLQVMAEDQIAADKQVVVNAQTGETLYDQNIALDKKFYIWKGDQQTIPLGMDGNPEQYAAQLAEALPGINTLRLLFNEHSFNPDGSLHEQYERFLAAAVAEGFDIVLLHASGDTQNIGNANSPGQTALSNTEGYAALEANFSVVADAWDKMLSWLDDHSAVKAGVTGYELMNEPAAYNHTIRANGSGEGLTRDDFVTLYANHVIALANEIQSQASGDILVSPWKYNGDIATLANTMIGGQSAIDYIAAGVGPDLVWSVHLYAGWSGTGAATTSEELAAILDAHFAPLQGQNVLLTEHNASGSVDDITGGVTTGDLFTQTYEWFAANGIGMGWFPGTETGGTALVSIDPDGSLRYLHQHSLAHALNAASLGDTVTGTGDENKYVTLVEGGLRNEPYEIDYDPDDKFDPVGEIGFAFGHDGDDTLKGTHESNDLLYGGDGNDRLIAGQGDDFLFGQNGNDDLAAPGGINHFFGGHGDDTMTGGTGYDQYMGGQGADLFVTGTSGGDVIVDFEAGTDRIDLGGHYTDFAQITAHLSAVDADADGETDDLQIDFGAGDALILLDVAAEDLSEGDFVGLDPPQGAKVECFPSGTAPRGAPDAFVFAFAATASGAETRAAPADPAPGPEFGALWIPDDGFFL